jgi:hypothetical protein
LKPFLLVFFFSVFQVCAAPGAVKTVKNFFSLAGELNKYSLIFYQKEGFEPPAAMLKEKAKQLCRKVFTGALLVSQIARADSLIDEGLSGEIFLNPASVSFVDYGDCGFFSKIEARLSFNQGDFVSERPVMVFSLEKRRGAWRIHSMIKKT